MVATGHFVKVGTTSDDSSGGMPNGLSDSLQLTSRLPPGFCYIRCAFGEKLLPFINLYTYCVTYLGQNGMLKMKTSLVKFSHTIRFLVTSSALL